MRRILYFLIGLVLLAFMTYFALDISGLSFFQDYNNQLQSYDAFWYVYYSIIVLLFIIAVVLIIMAFKPSRQSRNLTLKTHSGELEITKKAVDSYITKTISQYENIRFQNVQTKFKSNGSSKSISSQISILWLPDNEVNQASLKEINEDIQHKLEEFTNVNTESIKIQVVDQNKTDKRVI